MPLGMSPNLPGISAPGQPIETDPEIKFNFINPIEALSGSADAAVWVATADNGGSNVIADAAEGGVLRITPGTAGNDFRSLQMNGEAWAPKAGRTIIYEAKIRTNDADDIKFFVGLASTDTTGTTAGPILDGVNDSIGFRNIAGNAVAFQWVTEDDTNETTGAAGSLADNAWTIVRFELEGLDRITFFVNGTEVGKSKVNIPDAGSPLTLTLEVGSPTGTTATYLDVDYLYCTQTGN